MTARATAILPVKRFARAKTRLLAAIDPPLRAALLRAMLTDVLAALDRCRAIERAIVVTGEGRAERVALEAAKRLRLPIEVFQDPVDRGHSEAAVLGIVRAQALGASRCVLIPGDCPLLEADELAGALERLEPGTVAAVPDRHGSGTNALLLDPADAIGPAFGPGSCERHLDRAARAGWRAYVEPLPSMALDLDTPDDLRELAAALRAQPQRAPRTAEALRAVEVEA